MLWKCGAWWTWVGHVLLEFWKGGYSQLGMAAPSCSPLRVASADSMAVWHVLLLFRASALLLLS